MRKMSVLLLVSLVAVPSVDKGKKTKTAAVDAVAPFPTSTV